MRKGYKAEWEVKKILSQRYSPESIFKVAIGGATDFFVLGKKGEVIKIVEVKKTNKKKWYPTNRELKQYQKLQNIQKKFHIPVEYWIKINGKWEILNLLKAKKFFH